MLAVLIFTIIVVFLSFFVYKMKNKVRKPHILVTGQKSTGKTLIINHFLNQKFDTVPSLVSYSIETPKYIFTENRDLDNPEKYDLILYMFSGILDKKINSKNLIYCSLKTKPDTFSSSSDIISEDSIIYLNDNLKNIESTIENYFRKKLSFIHTSIF